MTGWLNGTMLIWIAALVVVCAAVVHSLCAIGAKADEDSKRMSDDERRRAGR